MTALESRIADRLREFGLTSVPALVHGLTTYLQLLQRWNPRVNLTALSLVEPIPDATIDKLVVEPLCVASLWPSHVQLWYDLGTGGGSPAIPLRLCHPEGELVMVEARGRKCAFLNEAIRVLGVERTRVLNSRFEDLQTRGSVDVVTVRAVRPDEDFARMAAGLLRPDGVLVGYGCSVSGGLFRPDGEALLPDQSVVTRFKRVFHVEH